MSGIDARRSQLYDEIARTAKALANGKRLELLDLLARGERTVEALARAAGLGVTSTSAHLQSLKQGGLVANRRDGVRIYYRLAGDDVADIYVRLRNVAARHLATVGVAASAYLGEGTEEVTRDELIRRYAAGELAVVDVRPREEYDAGHIPGALSIPLDALIERLAELPTDIEIVAYCRDAYCVLAPEAVRLLTAGGRSARRLADGMLEWRLVGLPVEKVA